MTPFKSSLVVVELMGFCYYCFCLYKTQLAKKKKKEKTVDLNVLVFFFFPTPRPVKRTTEFCNAALVALQLKRKKKESSSLFC